MRRSGQIVFVVSSTVCPCRFSFQTCSSAIATSMLYEESQLHQVDVYNITCVHSWMSIMPACLQLTERGKG
jgi:hypothetical protein